jgi:acetyltransferase-like isoleucine patch superfamily enzyme
MQPINRDSLPHLVGCLAGICKSVVHTGIARPTAWWWGVELGEGCWFFGFPLFRRVPGSHIRVGRNCQFRSAIWSNQVGLNRRCTVSTLSRGALIEIGEGCGFSSTAISAAHTVRLGNRVMCGANVAIMDTDWHSLDAEDRQFGTGGLAKPVLIEDDVWLGMNVTVLKGVTIGARTVVAAGSVVTRSLPADVIAAGQPTQVVRTTGNLKCIAAK